MRLAKRKLKNAIVTDETEKTNEQRKPTGRLTRLAKGLVILALLLLVMRLVFFSGPYQPVAKRYAEPIFDMHCHTAGIGAGGSGCFVSKELRNNFRFNIYLKAFGVTLAEVEAKPDLSKQTHRTQAYKQS